MKNKSFEILKKLYFLFIYLKNINNSYIAKNKNNIIDKKYFYILINIMTYKDIYITGEKFYPFLYINYYYKYKDFQKLISEKENIKKEINIYNEDYLKNEEKNEKDLQDEDIEETENEEESISFSYAIPKFLRSNLSKFIPERNLKMYMEVHKKIYYFYRIPFPINTLVNTDNINFTFKVS